MKKFILVLLPVAALAQSPDEQAMRAASVKFSSDYVRGDFQSMTDAYTEDALVMAPSRDAIVGKNGILKFWETTTAPASHESVPERIIIEGNVAHDYGYYYVQSQKPGEPAGPVNSAKYYIRWQKGSDGKWRMAIDMWNSRKTGWTK